MASPDSEYEFPALGFSYDENAEGYALYDEDENLVCYLAQRIVQHAPALAQMIILTATAKMVEDITYTMH